MRSRITKRWSVNAMSEGQSPLTLYCDGRLLERGGFDGICPVEFLLIAVASCFALSCRAILVRDKAPRTRFEVVVTGEKSFARNELRSVAVVAIFHDDFGDVEGAAVVEAAKPLCTVSNTLMASPHIVCGVRTLRDPLHHRAGVVPLPHGARQ